MKKTVAIILAIFVCTSTISISILLLIRSRTSNTGVYTELPTTLSSKQPVQINADLENSISTPTTGNTSNRTLLIAFVKIDDNTDNTNNPLNIFTVTRETSRQDVATFCLEQMLIGPTDQEKAYGYSNSLQLLKPGISSVGPDEDKVETPATGEEARTLFSINISNGVMYIDFKRAPYMVGDLTGGTIDQQIRTTMSQFSNITDVKISFNGDSCWNDMSGLCEE